MEAGPHLLELLSPNLLMRRFALSVVKVRARENYPLLPWGVVWGFAQRGGAWSNRPSHTEDDREKYGDAM